MRVFQLVAGAALLSAGAFAQNVAATWQGTLKTPERELRIVMKVTRESDESLAATFYSIDQNGRGVPASVKLQGGMLRATIPAISGNYEGKLSADGSTISGMFTQGSPLPLTLVKATPGTEWAIPEPPAARQLMAADAKPSFEVATIKPSDPSATGRALNVGRGGGNAFTTQNLTLSDLIKFAYAIHERQVSGGPSWMGTDRYDVLAKPDTAGIPNAEQVRSMVQKLLAERFGLKFHREQKELAAYVITVDKGGVKMTKAEPNRSPLPGYSGRGPGNLGVRNTTIAEFANFMQSRVLDRPVVDQTGLTDRYDFTLEFKPDGAQPGAAGPNAPALPPGLEDRPDLFTALRQQAGLKVESGKANVEVLVIDQVTKPTEN